MQWVEHRNLCPDQIKLFEPLAHLHTFCTQKMHQKITQEDWKIAPKQVTHYASVQRRYDRIT